MVSLKEEWLSKVDELSLFDFADNLYSQRVATRPSLDNEVYIDQPYVFSLEKTTNQIIRDISREFNTNTVSISVVDAPVQVQHSGEYYILPLGEHINGIVESPNTEENVLHIESRDLITGESELTFTAPSVPYFLITFYTSPQRVNDKQNVSVEDMYRECGLEAEDADIRWLKYDGFSAPYYAHPECYSRAISLLLKQKPHLTPEEVEEIFRKKIDDAAYFKVIDAGNIEVLDYFWSAGIPVYSDTNSRIFASSNALGLALHNKDLNMYDWLFSIAGAKVNENTIRMAYSSGYIEIAKELAVEHRMLTVLLMASVEAKDVATFYYVVTLMDYDWNKNTLIDIIKLGDPEFVSRYAELVYINKLRDSHLMNVALTTKSVPVIRVLLELGVPVDIVGACQETQMSAGTSALVGYNNAIMSCPRWVWSNVTPEVFLLLTEYGYTGGPGRALFYSIWGGNVELVDFLLSNAHVSQEEFLKILEKPKVWSNMTLPLFEVLLKHGYTGRDNREALRAAFGGNRGRHDFEFVKYLVSNKYVNPKGMKFRVPSKSLVKYRKIMKYLEKHGAVNTATRAYQDKIRTRR